MRLRQQWAEIAALLLLVIAYALVFSSARNTTTLIIMSILWGMVFGRLWYRCQGQVRFPWGMIITGFFLGLIIASLTLGYGKTATVFSGACFIVGIIISYYAHKTKLIKSSEY